MNKPAVDLFEGLMKGTIPPHGDGFIFNGNFATGSKYAIFEIIAFRNVKNIIPASDHVTFQSDGFKIYVLYEPKTYVRRYMEPYLREEEEKIPLRWEEVEIMELSRKDRLIISRTPFLSHGAFTVNRPNEANFSYFFFDNERVQKNLEGFMSQLLKNEFQVTKKRIEDFLPLFRKNLEIFRQESSAA